MPVYNSDSTFHYLYHISSKSSNWNLPHPEVLSWWFSPCSHHGLVSVPQMWWGPTLLAALLSDFHASFMQVCLASNLPAVESEALLLLPIVRRPPFPCLLSPSGASLSDTLGLFIHSSLLPKGRRVTSLTNVEQECETGSLDSACFSIHSLKSASLTGLLIV